MFNVERANKLYLQAQVDPVATLPQLLACATDQDELVRHVAAIQLAFHRPTELAESHMRELLATLLNESLAGKPRSELTLGYLRATDNGDDSEDRPGFWDLGQHIALAFAALPAGSADFAVPELILLWQRDSQFYEAVLAAIALAFAEGAQPDVGTLTVTQKHVLEALVNGDDAVWNCCADSEWTLEDRGLPASREELRVYLAS